jgi:hypothetical protein
MSNEQSEIENLIEKIEDLENHLCYVQFYLECLHKLIPIKYKKKFPKTGENPFLSSDEISYPSSKERNDAKERMANLLKEIKEES